MTRVVVSTDGYVAPTGEAGWAFVVDGLPEPFCRSGMLAAAPSHLAEWTAMWQALAWAEGTLEEGDSLELRTDSALVAKGLARRSPAIGGEAGLLRAECRQALARLAQRKVRSVVKRVSRTENTSADLQARRASGHG